jgi:hypothetical protein
MIRYSLLFCLLLLMQGCGSDEQKLPPKPEQVLSKDSMAFYLSQVHIIDAAMRHRDVRKKSLQPEARQGFVNYFDTAGVSKERFVESVDYWKLNYVEMEEIYNLSMEILSTKLAVLKKVESKDSLKAVNSKKR